MPAQKLSDMLVKKLTPPAKGQKDYYDAKVAGLCIRVSYGGSKSWYIKYNHAGKQRRAKLGPYPTLSLSEARKEAEKFKRTRIVEGVDPAQKMNADGKALSVEKLFDLYIERHAKVKKRSWKEDQRILNRYFSKWHQRNAGDISKLEVAELLAKIAKNNGGHMANRCLACIRKTYNFGIRSGLLEINPAQAVDKPYKEISRDRVYSESEVTMLWEAFEQRGVAGNVFKMCLITGQRLSEVSGMRWNEMHSEKWLLPKERTKNGRAHVVPLSTMALDLLSELGGFSETWCFPSPKGLDQPVGIGSADRNFVRAASGIEDFRPHDLRRTVQTNITLLGFPRFIADRLLNHADVGIGAIYDQNDYFKEKKEAVDSWASMLLDLVQNASNQLTKD